MKIHSNQHNICISIIELLNLFHISNIIHNNDILAYFDNYNITLHNKFAAIPNVPVLYNPLIWNIYPTENK